MHFYALALWSGKEDLVKEVLRFVDVDRRIENSRSYLHIAAMTNNLRIFKLIYDSVQDKLPIDDFGKLPLEVCADKDFQVKLETFLFDD